MIISAPIIVNIPHTLGQEEAGRRIKEGFGRLRRKISGGLLSLVSFDERWEGNILFFKGSSLGQVIAGQIDVGPESVKIQLDLPPILAAMAGRIVGKVETEGQKLLEKK